jgi:hypothetical protein
LGREPGRLVLRRVAHGCGGAGVGAGSGSARVAATQNQKEGDHDQGGSDRFHDFFFGVQGKSPVSRLHRAQEKFTLSQQDYDFLQLEIMLWDD